MKPYRLFLLPVFLLAGAVGPTRDLYLLSSEYTVTIDGTSNLRDWKESIDTVSGTMEAQVNPDGSIGLNTIRICMKVMSIKSDMGRVMEKKTYEALKANAHPEIVFTLSTPVNLTPVRNAGTAISVSGNLLLAGVSKPVTMLVKTFEISQGKLQFEGYQHLKMTDFGVRPPTALFGTMRASADITIHFKTNFINQRVSNNLKN